MHTFSDDLRGAKAEDAAAFCRLSERCAPVIAAVARWRLRGPLKRHYDPDDLRQSVMLEVLRDLPKLEDRGEAAFRRWVELKAVSKVNRRWRRHLKPKGGRRELTLPPGLAEKREGKQPTPSVLSMGQEAGEGLRLGITQLDEHYRLVIRLRLQEALPFKEVAEWMTLPSAEAARKLYARAILRLQRVLKASSPEP